MAARPLSASLSTVPLPGALMASGKRAHNAMHPAWWRTRSRTAAVRARRLQREAEARFPVITHVAERMVAVNIFDSATRLAAQCFLTAVPLVFAVASFAPEGLQQQMAESVRAVFGLTGEASEQVDDIFGGTDSEFQNAVGLVGALMVLLSSTAVSRAMQRLCKRAWEIPRTGVHIAIWRWVAWIGVWVFVLIVQGPVRNGFGVGLWLGIPLTFVFLALAWWWSQHLLLGGLVGWLPLLPGAVLTALGSTALSLVARFYMPRALNRALSDYGSAGSVFVLLSWLIVVCVAIAIGVTAGAVLAQEPFLAGRLGSPPPKRLRDDQG
ncbi:MULTISPECIES: YhjD/YihY/BrkB family envelope integrity protein [unclassified Streptomyces]|uniref:YhjD/YihY/BrkB family envelope integrity protein n=1 Tax=Streptomyces sp. R33 TaxID=3238629 RepID=A0AB39YFP3_9ACTN|nr:YhjD/YihY/BrkB family envelope integrity protein [Streptomyces sp. XY332]